MGGQGSVAVFNMSHMFGGLMSDPRHVIKKATSAEAVQCYCT